MNKGQGIIKIIINIIAVIVLVVAVYMLMFKDLSQWQSSLSTVLIVIAIPLIVIPILAKVAFKKYDNLPEAEDELGEEEL